MASSWEAAEAEARARDRRVWRNGRPWFSCSGGWDERVYGRWLLVGRALLQHAKCEDNRSLSFVARWGYTLKVVVCVLANWCYDWKRHGEYPKTVDVALYDYSTGSGPDGTTYDWTNLQTSVGRPWFYREDRDGAP